MVRCPLQGLFTFHRFAVDLFKPNSIVRNVCAEAPRWAKKISTILRVWRCSFMLVDCYTTRGFAIDASVLVQASLHVYDDRANCARVSIARELRSAIRKKTSHKQALYKPYKPTNHHLEHTCCAHCVYMIYCHRCHGHSFVTCVVTYSR